MLFSHDARFMPPIFHLCDNIQRKRALLPSMGKKSMLVILGILRDDL